MDKTVLVAVANGSEEMETVTIIDVLRRAGLAVVVASVQTQQITCSRGVKLVADKEIKDCLDEDFDMIALPGGVPGADNLRDSAELIELLNKQKNANRYYAAICASPAVVFQSHGLLEGTKATCYPAFMEQLNSDAKSESRVVVDGYCVTSRGPGTAIDFSLKLVELLISYEKAKEVADAMLVDYEL